MSASQVPALEPQAAGVPVEDRPILVRSGGHIVPAVDVAPALLSANRWQGFTMEVLETPASEVPPRASLIRHLVCSIDSAEPFRFFWREHGREYEKLVTAGDHLIRSQQEMAGFRWDRSARALILGIDPSTMESIVSDIAPPRALQLREFYGVPDDYLHSLMRALAADLAHDSPTGPMLGESLCTSIAVHAARRYAVFLADDPRAGAPISHRRLKLLVDFIDSRLSQDLSLFELARVASISPFYLTRMFKARMGVSVHQYVLDQRIDRAKRLLERTTLDLSEIARAIGFRHQSHLSQVFRRRAGVTPQQYRRASNIES